MADEEKPMNIGSTCAARSPPARCWERYLPALTAHAADKTLVWGKPAEITSFDVHVAGTVTVWEMYEMVYETLLTADENLKVQPALAESWEQTSPTSYVFKLRPDAKFSNGRPVTAADVAGTSPAYQGSEDRLLLVRPTRNDRSDRDARRAHREGRTRRRPTPRFSPRSRISAPQSYRSKD